MGFRVAVGYSDADADDRVLREVDFAIRLGPAPASESYLSVERVIAAAASCHADMIHPGYGFLSEDRRLAEAAEQANIIFVGPSSLVLRQLGSKGVAREIAQRLGVPTLAGYSGPNQTDEAFVAAVARLGYPVVFKPAGGGGGKGMAVARADTEIIPALGLARRAGRTAFGNADVILESYLERVRHVEVQVLRDSYGNAAVLGDRDCSLQRRHQKIVEESPAPGLDDRVRRALHDSARAIMEDVAYLNAGTVEFVVSGNEYYFIEANPRLQVEHPVTEVVWGVDLVEQQFRIAMGESVPSLDGPRGHAVEARVYAEDPAEDFRPSGGRLEHVSWPGGVRVDAGADEGAVVTAHYDGLIGKVIAHGTGRGSALDKLADALRDCSILGAETNLAFLRRLVQDLAGTETLPTTDFIDSLGHIQRARPTSSALALAAALVASRNTPVAARQRIYLADEQEAHLVAVELDGQATRAANMEIAATSEPHEWLVNGQEAAAVKVGSRVWVDLDGNINSFESSPPERTRTASLTESATAPMAGRVISVKASSGERVVAGQPVMALEAMKMELTIRADRDGTIRILSAEGDQVVQGTVLFQLVPE